MTEISNANEELKDFTGTEGWHDYTWGYLTDGAKALADNFQCYWFLDIICSYQRQLWEQPFQVWTLKRFEETNAAVVTCTDGNRKVLVKQDILFTDFKPLQATVWVEHNVLLLPSEH